MRKQKYLALAMLTLIASAQLAFAQDTTVIPESNTVAANTDTTYPADVAGVKAVPGDKMITLSWTAATDNVGVKGYKIFYGNTSVSADSASYTQGPVDVGNVLTYDVKNLENGKPYYFAVTAYDAAGNESEFYSTEVSGTPGAATTVNDKTAPKVLSAAAIYDNKVKVVFSEAVKLPATKPETAFAVKEDLVGTVLNITKAVVDTTDASGKTVLLTTSTQKKATKYVLTVGIQLQDLAGNPMVSGTSDTAVFSGTDALAPEEIKPAADSTADTTAPTFTAVQSTDANTVQVTFSEPVVLLTNAVENFIITDAADNTKITNVKKVTIDAGGTKVTLTTDNLEAKKYNLIALKVKDVAGNLMPVESSATTFDGTVAATTTTDTTTTTTPTVTKPENAASDLVAKAVANLIVNLSWNTKADKMANAANFVLYMSTDRGATYGNGIVLGKDVKMYDFNNLTADMVYYFKLTTRDAAGNESDGLVTFMTLPKTGPEVLFLLFGSAGASALVNRKKKLKK